MSSVKAPPSGASPPVVRVGGPAPPVFAALLASVGIAAVAAAFVVAPIENTLVRRAIDGALAVVFVSPFLWWFGIRPLRRAAEGLLEESERRYHTLFASMREGYAYCRILYEEGVARDFVYLDVNEAFERLTGLRDIVGRKVSEVVPGIRESNPELLEIYGRVATTGKPETFETYVEPLRIWFRIFVYSPQPEYFVAIFENVTDRREAERALRESEERLRQLVENISEVFFVMDAQYRETFYVSPGYEKVWGRSCDTLYQAPSSFVEPVPPEDRERLVAYISRVQGGEDPGEIEFRVTQPDGHVRWVIAHAVPVRNAQNEVDRIVGVTRDITDRHQLEQQLRQSQKMEAVGLLTGGIAHDFNNVLGVILANTDLIAMAGAGESTEESIAEIRAAALRGAAMIRKLMAFSRHSDLELLPVNLNQVVGGLSGILRRLLPESITIEEHLDAAIGTVKADIGAVEQVLLNLATNARDAMPEGGALRIEISPTRIGDEFRATHPWASPGDYVCLSVGDSGAGMDDETKRRMFEPFFTTKPIGKGTGLGMAMIYGLVKQHLGLVHVYSELGKGTRVKIYFPVAAELTPITVRPAAGITHALGGNETILVAEDEVALRLSAKRILQRLGYTVLLAADGEEALAMYHAHREDVDLVISDMIMPKLGGRELYEAIQDEGRPVRFIIASGYTPSDLRVEGGSDPHLRFIAKPWTIADLASTVRSALDQPLAR
jgi:PAS domain S-box-containing protein